MAVTKHKSENVSQRRDSERNDERVRRTRKRLDAAFVELLHRRPYGNIRVSDIVKKAGVGRPTFYAHYATKDDLLRSQFDRIVAPMLSVMPGGVTLDATYLFAHIGTAPHFWKAFMGSGGGTAPHVLRACFEARIRALLSLGPAHATLKQSATARAIASSLIAIIECWLEQGAHETPPQVQAIFATFQPGVAADSR